MLYERIFGITILLIYRSIALYMLNPNLGRLSIASDGYGRTAWLRADSQAVTEAEVEARSPAISRHTNIGSSDARCHCARSEEPA